MSRPSFVFRFTPMDFLPRLCSVKMPVMPFFWLPRCRIMSPTPGDSTFVTSAPWSASIIAASGPEIMTDRSTTLTPASGPVLLLMLVLQVRRAATAAPSR